MEVAAPRPSRLLPLRIVAAVVLVVYAVDVTKTVAGRMELLAEHPALTQKMLATMIAVSFFGALAISFLAFWRQRFGLWFAMACGAIEFALEAWAGFSLLVLLRLPVAAAFVFLATRYAWPELRGLMDAPRGDGTR